MNVWLVLLKVLMAPEESIRLLSNRMEEDVCFESYPQNAKETDVVRQAGMEKSLDNFHAFGVIDIIRESFFMLQKNVQCFVWILTVLLLPLSAILLCLVFISDPIVDEVAWQIESAENFHSFPMNRFCKIVYIKMIDNLVSGALCFPFFLTLWLLAKAAVTHKISCYYNGLQEQLSLKTVFASYTRLFCTYLLTTAILLGTGFAFVLLLVALNGLVHILRFTSEIAYVLSIFIGIIFSLVFAHLVIISNLANVVSITETSCGTAAIERAFFLLKGRAEAGLVMLLSIASGTALVEGLFLYETFGRSISLYNVFTSGSLSMMWEAPNLLPSLILIVLYSFVKLLDLILNTIYYFTCKASQDRCDVTGDVDINSLI